VATASTSTCRTTRRAEGDADPDLARAPGDAERDHAVESHPREQHREAGEPGHRARAGRHRIEGHRDQPFERTRLQEDEVRINRAQRPLDVARRGTRIARGPHEEARGRRRPLRSREVNHGARRFAEAALVVIAGDADDLDERPRLIAQAHRAAHRALAREESLRERLGDDRHARALGRVAAVECPAVDDPDAHRAEVAGADASSVE
jgi:hypothetical protein